MKKTVQKLVKLSLDGSLFFYTFVQNKTKANIFNKSRKFLKFFLSVQNISKKFFS